MAKRAKGKDALLPAHGGGQRRRSVFVFTEGKVTEPKYIEAIKALVEVPVNVHIANGQAPDSRRTPADLLTQAVKLLEGKEQEDRKAKLPRSLKTQVWCIFDHDSRDRNELNSLLAQAKQRGVEVAFSNPCFEVWRLLHLKSANGTFGGICGQVVQRLPQEFHQTPGGIKHVVPEQISGRFEAARKRALEMNGQHPEHLPLPSMDPYTDVHRFVEYGMGVIAY
ncbi:RloB family protein [Streptosporangium sp. NBC_01756]|uniref:RloB family protein n=1 Tax=Streptosporangium sp. NBC_01756 TaxID=2975950 RepID=UPI002DDC314A|nr:RloB family protein [Streptosporangium sp. NBC_01756]WSC84692.1 RloB family protein [Streptosporangium sp. NBC_01756]